ncbi:hypothetical protein [Amycolatopsis cihanbeyliensis]|uniref:Uncharacterized protein n=1 Tax=Amycolatopsis cihanbeyliensis TaxID=1128664 RepID=A0A542DL61_AMYCI|nr:hypothetical protein [Amycolatopsis cihanbeyliensis]TQJ03803.1 hypothetical protein FB471_3571 [Amycolatopsis cihanbeyliensis]
MPGRTRKATAVSAAALVLAGSAALAAPATAVAETKTAQCGGTVKAKPGDRVRATLLGIPLDLGIVSEATTVLTGTVSALLGKVCTVTVQVVDTVVAPVPGVGEPAADAINKGVQGTSNTLSDTANTVGGAVTGGGTEPVERNRPNQPAPGGKPGGSPGSNPTTGGPGRGDQAGGVPESNSPVLGGAAVPGFPGLPTDFSTGFAPMRDYSNLPIATAGLYAPSPGVRYGGQIPGYAPEFGILGQQGTQDPPDDGVRNAGDARALTGGAGGPTDGTSLPLLLAVIALAGASGALVRTWVLRKA